MVTHHVSGKTRWETLWW